MSALNLLICATALAICGLAMVVTSRDEPALFVAGCAVILFSFLLVLT